MNRLLAKILRLALFLLLMGGLISATGMYSSSAEEIEIDNAIEANKPSMGIMYNEGVEWPLFTGKEETNGAPNMGVNHRQKKLFLETINLHDSENQSNQVEEIVEEPIDTTIMPEEPTEFLKPGQYRTKKQNMYHEIAEMARAAGLGEDSPIILEVKRLWEQEQYDLNIMAKVGFKEAGGCEWQQLLDTIAVVKNRVDSPYWPNTVYDVVVAPAQYLKSYTRNFEGVSARAYAAAVIIMDETYTIPKNVVFQANFPQGSGTWRIAECHVGSFHSTTWFGYDLASREYPDD